MRIAITLILLASLGCGQSPAPVVALPTAPVETRTPDQIAAQEMLATVKKNADIAAYNARWQRVLDRLDTVEQMDAYLLFDKRLLESVAEGKESLASTDKVRQRVWDEILANDFHSLGL